MPRLRAAAAPVSPTQQLGARAEDRALACLLQSGLTLLERNAASALGELDLVMRDGATVVFVEVRARADARYGGAAASVTPAKQRRLRRIAQQWLQARAGGRWPPCRFDVVAIDGGRIDWIRDAF